MWYNEQTRKWHKGNRSDRCICCGDDVNWYMLCEDPRDPGYPLSCTSSRGGKDKEKPCPEYDDGENPWTPWNPNVNPYLPMFNFMYPIDGGDGSGTGVGINPSIPDNLTGDQVYQHVCEASIFGCTDERYIRKYSVREDFWGEGRDRIDGSWMAALDCGPDDIIPDDLNRCVPGMVETFPLPIYVSTTGAYYIMLTLTGDDPETNIQDGFVPGHPIVYAVRTLDGDDYNEQLEFRVDEYVFNYMWWFNADAGTTHYGDSTIPVYEPQNTSMMGLSLYDKEDIQNRPDGFSGGDLTFDITDINKLLELIHSSPVSYQHGILSDVNYDLDFNGEDVFLSVYKWIEPAGYCETYHEPNSNPSGCKHQICDALRGHTLLWSNVGVTDNTFNYIARECNLPIDIYDYEYGCLDDSALNYRCGCGVQTEVDTPEPCMDNIWRHDQSCCVRGTTTNRVNRGPRRRTGGTSY